VRSRYSEENMPNPEVLICHHFKYDTALSGMLFLQSLPSKLVVLPMHAIDAPKHPKKSSCYILYQDSSSVLFIWCSQVVLSEYCHHRSTKFYHGFKACWLNRA
jgi:hypothetical protein